MEHADYSAAIRTQHRRRGPGHGTGLNDSSATCAILSRWLGDIDVLGKTHVISQRSEVSSSSRWIWRQACPRPPSSDHACRHFRIVDCWRRCL